MCIRDRYVRVPFADQGLNKIPDGVTDRQALLVGDVLATGYWAARISEITPEDTVLILGAGPTGICTLLCVMLHSPKMCIRDSSTPASWPPPGMHWQSVLRLSPLARCRCRCCSTALAVKKLSRTASPPCS